SGQSTDTLPNTLSNADKVYGLSKFWHEVKHNFVFLHQVDQEKWEADYQALISEVQATSNDYEYYRLLQKFCATLKDGHTNISFPPEIRSQLYTTYFGDYRLFLTNIEGKAVITRTNWSKKEELPIGTEVIKVNGLTTAAYIAQEVAPYIASSTDYIVEDLSVTRLFRAPKGTRFEVEFKLPDGRYKTMNLVHTETTEKEVYPPFEDRALLDFKWLPNDIAYVALNSFSEEKIDALFVEKLPELYKAKAIIVDLRYNDGGSTKIGLDILQYLTKDTLLYGSRSYSRLHIPSFKAWGAWTEAKDTIQNAWAKQEYLSYHDAYFHAFPYSADTIRLTQKRIVVPTALLTAHRTASAAEDFLIYADNQEHMVKIGEETFGSTGQPILFQLPGGANARVCTKNDTYPDGRPFIGYGIQPDIPVKVTLEDYQKNHDPVLAKAASYLESKINF
ncbi:MAG: S41 family peptidase, partial [Bacteroidota bacterium]